MAGEKKKKDRCLAMIMIPSENGFKALFRCERNQGHQNKHRVSGISETKSADKFYLKW